MESGVFCAKCGSAVKPGGKFCTKCGTPVPASTVQPEQPAAKADKKASAPPPAEKLKKKFKMRMGVWESDRFVPSGQLAPHWARAAGFAFDLFLFLSFATLVFWIVVLWPLMAEMKAYVSTEGQLALSPLFSRLLVFIVSCVIFVVFYVVIPVGATGMTLGKFLAGIKVTTIHDDPVSLQHVIPRYCAYIISALPFFLGFAIAFRDESRRTWHDRISKTHVIHVKKVGSVKSAFLWMAPVLLLFSAGSAWWQSKLAVEKFELREPFEIPNPGYAAELYCKAPSKPFNLFFLLPPEYKKGSEGLSAFITFYTEPEQFSSKVGVSNVPGAVCKVEEIQKLRKVNTRVVRVYFSFSRKNAPQGMVLRKSTAVFMREGTSWYLKNESFESNIKRGFPLLISFFSLVG